MSDHRVKAGPVPARRSLSGGHCYFHDEIKPDLPCEAVVVYGASH